MAEHAHITPAPMSALSITSRRHLLSSLAGLGFAGTVLVAAVPTGAQAGEHPDAELLALLADVVALELEIYPPGYEGPESAEDTPRRTGDRRPYWSASVH